MRWMILQQEESDDFVIATGKLISVREFIRMPVHYVGGELLFSGHRSDKIATAVILSGDNTRAFRLATLLCAPILATLVPCK